MRRALAFGLLVWGCAPSDPPADAPPAESLPADVASSLETRLNEAGVEARTLDVETVADDEVYALAEATSREGSFLVQWADLRRVALEQVLGEEVRPADEGAFHPSATSPFFALLVADSVVSRAMGPGLLSVMNGAFFETPGQPSTQLAFPLVADGAVVTGGSSPYGPGRPGATGERWNRPLRALALTPEEATIVPYDHTTGAPLADSSFADALVSFAPEAHPNRTQTRFHVLGALDRDGDGTTETLVAVTSDGQTTIEQTNAVLDAMGIAPEARLTTDGGASVFVWNRDAGVLHRPASDQPLPHYLTLRLR